MSILGFRARTVKPSLLTTDGNNGAAMPTLFWTLSAAICTFVPTLKVTFILIPPVLVLVLCMYSMPGVPFTCSSIGVATVCSTVSASAPVYCPDIETAGGVIFGYWSTARLKIHIIPEIIITTEITIAVTGLLINVLAIIVDQVYVIHVQFESHIPIQDQYFVLQLF